MSTNLDRDLPLNRRTIPLPDRSSLLYCRETPATNPKSNGG